MQSLVFFGSDQYSITILERLINESKSDVVMVVTDQAKPKGRKQIVEPNSVEKLAKMQNIKIAYYPDKGEDLNNLINTIRSAKAELGVAASFDHLLPSSIISLFPQGVLNIHPSLLPQYRNVSPVQYAVAMGDQVTGVSIFKISEGIDNGEIIAQDTESIIPSHTTTTLSQKLFKKGADLLIKYLTGEQVPPIDPPINQSLIFTRRLTRESGYLEWEVLQKLLNNQEVSPVETKNNLLALRLTHNPQGSILHDLTRALSPWPGIWTTVSTPKGEIRLTFTQIMPKVMVKIAGKPKPIGWSDFSRYYLANL